MTKIKRLSSMTSWIVRVIVIGMTRRTGRVLASFQVTQRMVFAFVHRKA